MINQKTNRDEEKEKIESIRAKNRESARRSRAKKTQDLIFLLEENKVLKKENQFLKSKIEQLCPHCKSIFTSKSINNNNLVHTKFIINKPTPVVTPDNHQGNPHRKIAGIIGIISLLCIFANIFYTSSQIKNIYIILMNSHFAPFHSLILPTRSISL